MAPVEWERDVPEAVDKRRMVERRWSECLSNVSKSERRSFAKNGLVRERWAAGELLGPCKNGKSKSNNLLFHISPSELKMPATGREVSGELSAMRLLARS